MSELNLQVKRYRAWYIHFVPFVVERDFLPEFDSTLSLPRCVLILKQWTSEGDCEAFHYIIINLLGTRVGLVFIPSKRENPTRRYLVEEFDLLQHEFAVM